MFAYFPFAYFSKTKSHGALGFFSAQRLREYEDDPRLVSRLHRAHLRLERRRQEDQRRLRHVLSVILSGNHRNIIGNSSVIVGSFYGKFMEIISLKSPGNYSASIWINIFSICLGESLKTIISMISGFWDVSLSSKANIIYLRRPQET